MADRAKALAHLGCDGIHALAPQPALAYLSTSSCYNFLMRHASPLINSRLARRSQAGHRRVSGPLLLTFSLFSQALLSRHTSVPRRAPPSLRSRRTPVSALAAHPVRAQGPPRSCGAQTVG